MVWILARLNRLACVNRAGHILKIQLEQRPGHVGMGARKGFSRYNDHLPTCSVLQAIFASCRFAA